MQTEYWQGEARKYALLSDQARAEYWAGLTSQQQHDLQEALSGVRSDAKPKKRGCSGPLASGCLGMILGAIITIGIEISLVMMGVQAISDTFNSMAGGGTAGVPASSSPVGQPDFSDVNPYELLQYCGTEWEAKYDKIASVCAENRTNENINRNVYKERQERYEAQEGH